MLIRREFVPLAGSDWTARVMVGGLQPATVLDMGGHGYATVKATADAFETEFVCIPRPVERDTREEGGPLKYRVRHRAALWRAGESPTLARLSRGVLPLT